MAETVAPDRKLLLRRMLAQRALGGHDIVARVLRGRGVTTVYGISGTPVDQTLAACARVGIRVVGTRHQQAATLMSAAHNYTCGSLASAVIVSSGPAVTNCATGVLVASENGWPLLVIGGRRALSMHGRGAFQDFDGAGFYASTTRCSEVVSHTGQLAAVLEHCCESAVADRGPAYLDVTEEALSGTGIVPPDAASGLGASDPRAPGSVPFDARCTAAELTAAAAALGRARRPALLVGEDARWSEPWTPLRQIVERFGIPFATSPMARGFLPDSHPLCFSDVRGPLLDGADLVMAVGVRFDWTFRFGREIGPESTVLAIGVGASDLGEIASPRIVVPGSPVHILPVLLEACDSGAARDDSRTDALGEQRTAYRSRIEQRCAQRLDPMSPFQWLRELRDALPASAMTILDGNVVMSAAQAVLRAELPLSRITPGKTGCMGSAIPFAIGAQLAQGDRPVVAICGDFAFGLNALELETAVRLEVPIIVIVANNGGLGGVTRQRALYGANHPDRVCEFAQGVRHDRLMAALGGLGLRVERPGELAGALATALAHGGPSCIDVMTNGETELSAVL